MTIDGFLSLLSPKGGTALERAVALRPDEKDFLRHFTKLRQDFDDELARAALETAILRRSAVAKFGDAASYMFFTREALEQASAPEVSEYRSERFVGFGAVADLGCSIGSDAIKFAEVTNTIGVDIDPLRVVIANANADAAGVDENVVFSRADIEEPLPFDEDTALFFDPARRDGERRINSVNQYHPPLSIVKRWLRTYPDIGVKLSPAVKISELDAYDGTELEFISLNGELKEAVLWFGDLRTRYNRRATVLPGPHTMVAEEETPAVDIVTPQGYLYEPDPAVMRAGLVKTLAADLKASQLDADIAFLTSDKHTSTPFARVYVVEDWLPFGLKRLREYLRERDVGRVTIIKRGSPLDTTKLTRDLKLSGNAEKTIVLTHHDGKPIVIVVRRIE